MNPLEVKVTQLCLTFCDPMGHTDHVILQARILEWVDIPFSRGSSQSKDRTQVSCITGRFFTSWATKEAKGVWGAYENAFQVLLEVKNPPANAGDRRHGFSPGIGKIPWRRAWQPTPVFLPGESLGQRSLVGYSPFGRKQSDMTERLSKQAGSSLGQGLTGVGHFQPSPGELPTLGGGYWLILCRDLMVHH